MPLGARKYYGFVISPNTEETKNKCRNLLQKMRDLREPYWSEYGYLENFTFREINMVEANVFEKYGKVLNPNNQKSFRKIYEWFQTK